MKKSPEERFEKELLQALRGPMPASERNAARSRVSRRLQVTLSHLEVGAAAALPLLLEAPQVAATQSAAGLAVSSKVLAATTSGVGGAAAATGTAAAGASLAAAVSHPLGVLVTAFALGAGVGGAAFVALSPAAQKVEPGAHASSTGSLSPRSLAPRPGSKASSRPVFEPGRGTPSSAGATPVTESVRRESPPPTVGKEAPSAVSSSAVRRNQAARAAGSEPLEGPRADTLTAQQALLDRARALLSRGQGREALTALSEHSRVHPSSELAEEREALTIKALIASGDFAGAHMRAANFGALYPRSLFLPSIRVALQKNP